MSFVRDLLESSSASLLACSRTACAFSSVKRSSQTKRGAGNLALGINKGDRVFIGNFQKKNLNFSVSFSNFYSKQPYYLYLVHLF